MRALEDERGSVLVIAGIVTVALVLLGTVIIEVGHAMTHRRHLQVQVDAAALAAAQEFPRCTTDPTTAYPAMQTVANQYGGFGGSTSYNQQVGTGGYAGTVASAYQVRAYPPGGTAHAQDPDDIFNSDTTTLTCGVPGDPNSIKMFDVKATEYGIHNIFSFAPFSTVHAHARVELKAVNEAKGLLPLAVPDVRPRYVFAKFVAESGTISCTDSGGAAVASCEEQLTKGAVVGGQQQWVPQGAPLNVRVPTGDLGVRIRLVGGTDPNAQCGTLYTECYDAGSANGLVHIRGWDSNASAPVVKDASLTNGSCVPDAYFVVFTTTTSCNAGITADIDLGASRPLGGGATTQVWATVDGTGTYQLSTSGTGTGVHTWSSVDPLPITGDGPHAIRLDWTYRPAGCTSNGCTDSASNAFKNQLIQRAFVASPDLSGPLQLAQVYESPATFGPYSFQGGSTHAIGVIVQTMGNLLLSRPTDQPINLKVGATSGGQTQSIDCDPGISNLRDEIQLGCSPWYQTQTALTCPVSTAPALWALLPAKLTCVPIQTGQAVGQVWQGLNQRIYGSSNPSASACTDPNEIHWIRDVGFSEITWPNDKRVLPLFVTPLGTFSGSGSDVVPLIDFGYFYVTGYKNDPCAGTANQDPVTNDGSIRGHFVKFFPLDDLHGGDTNCDLESITPCIGVLTR